MVHFRKKANMALWLASQPECQETEGSPTAHHIPLWPSLPLPTGDTSTQGCALHTSPDHHFMKASTRVTSGRPPTSSPAPLAIHFFFKEISQSLLLIRCINKYNEKASLRNPTYHFNFKGMQMSGLKRIC